LTICINISPACRLLHYLTRTFGHQAARKPDNYKDFLLGHGSSTLEPVWLAICSNAIGIGFKEQVFGKGFE